MNNFFHCKGMEKASIISVRIVFRYNNRKGGRFMAEKDFAINDIVEMKKPHPCGENNWKIIRMGMDIRIKCLGCDHSVMIPRREFTKKLKRVIKKAASSS